MPTTSRPRFSVVIPCFNQGMFLGECLESVLAQRRPADEIIVVNDGSTDPHTTRVMRELCRAPVQLVEQENRGLAGARNAGIQRATGDWIVPLDSDDRMTPDALALYEEAIAREPGVDIWYPDIQHFGLDTSLYLSPEPNMWRQLTVNQLTCNAAIRRKVFEAGVQYNGRLRPQGWEDWEFYIHACSEKDFVARPLGVATFLYRKWGYSMLSSTAPAAARLREQLKEERSVYSNDARLHELKQRHSPFFAVAACGAGVRGALKTQTLRDWRVVDETGRVSREGGFAAFRGGPSRALLVSWDDTALARALREDVFLLDKIARVVESRQPSVLWLAATTDGAGAYPGVVTGAEDAERVGRVRGIGFVLAMREYFMGLDVQAVSDELPADLAAAVIRSRPGSMLQMVVGSAAEGVGFAMPALVPPPPPPAPQPVAAPAVPEPPMSRRAMKLLARRSNLIFRAVVGDDLHERIRHTNIFRTLKSRIRGERPALEAAVPPAPEPVPPPPPPSRDLPVDPVSFREERHRNAVWHVANEPARREPMALSTRPGLLIAVPFVAQGGADRAVIDLVQGLSRVAPDVRKYVVTTLGTRMQWADQLLPHLDGFFSAADLAHSDPGGLLAQLVDSLQIDTVLISNSQVAFDALPALRAGGRRVRVVAHVHSFIHDAATGELSGHPAYAASRYNSLIDEYVTISKSLGRTLSEKFYVSPTKIRTVYLGIDVPRFARARRERLTSSKVEVLWLGRLSEEKDPLTALRVAEEWQRRRGPGVFHLTLAGGGPLQAEVAREWRERGLEECVTLTGPVSDPVPLWQRADALMMTSRYEGIPVVIYEALAAGVPVVAPVRNTCIEEVLTEGDAWLIREQSRPDEYVAALEQLAADRDLARERAQRLVSMCKRFEVGRYSAEMLEVLFPGRPSAEVRRVS